MPVNKLRNTIPWLMAAARAALGPALIAAAAARWTGALLATMVVTALASDIFDGILARRWACDTPGIRLFDSMADTVFYLCTAAALWLAHPQVLRDNKLPLLILLGCEALRFAFDLAKYRKPTSYHSYLAKFWGLLLASAVIAHFADARSDVIMPLALWVGVVANLESFALSLMLPRWQPDVRSLPAGWRLRQHLLAAPIPVRS